MRDDDVPDLRHQRFRRRIADVTQRAGARLGQPLLGFTGAGAFLGAALFVAVVIGDAWGSGAEIVVVAAALSGVAFALERTWARRRALARGILAAAVLFAVVALALTMLLFSSGLHLPRD